ncbi:MAG TPA: DNA mismatch repair protein MutS [Thiomicrospira sp.]|nr:DNA mismatch repair protein MutS [Thiomicrospira sp.]
MKRVKRKQKVYKTSLETDNPHKLDKAKHVTKVTTFESLFYHQKGIRLQELSKLKKGDFTVQAVLDLHGLTIDQAEIESLDFIHRAYQEYFRYIRIIHGKGYNSDDSYPALKNLVNQILRQTKLVLAFSSTPEKDGGTGAVNIFLKSH